MPVIIDGSAAPTTADLTSVTVSTTSVVVAAENLERRFLSIYNASAATAYVALAETATSDAFSFPLTEGSFWESPLSWSHSRPRPFAGVVSAVTTTGTATLKVTEW